jgi:hypothetical protein
LVALPDPALEFALQKLGRHVRDEWPREYFFEPFEYIGRFSHSFSSFSMKPRPGPPSSATSFCVALAPKNEPSRAVVKKSRISSLAVSSPAQAELAVHSTLDAHNAKFFAGYQSTVTSSSRFALIYRNFPAASTEDAPGEKTQVRMSRAKVCKRTFGSRHAC